MAGGTDAPISFSMAFDRQPFRVWRDVFCDELLGADAPGRPRELAGHVDGTLASGVIAVDVGVGVPGLTLARSASRIATETRPAAAGLTFVLHGACRLLCEGREFVLRPGDVSLLTSSVPFEKSLGEGYREYFMYMPAAATRALAGHGLSEPRNRIAPPQGLGALLADTLASLARRRRELRAADWPPLLGAISHLVETAFGAPSADATERARPAARVLQRERVLRYVEAHLAEPGLSPSTVASALGMSVRYLHLLFEDAERSFGETLLALRLDRCRERLADPGAADLRVSEIAFAAGFNDAAHFARAFKARFGMRPRDVRG